MGITIFPTKSIILCLLFLTNHWVQSNDNIINPYFHFPIGGPYMGILTALAIPIDTSTPGPTFFSLNFEASYGLPENQTDFQFPPIIGQTTRAIFYDFFEKKLESHGYPGRPCLLRTICEAAEFSALETGLFGDVIQFILTPSMSLNSNLTTAYTEAENAAKTQKRCKKYRKKCKFSLLKVISWSKNVLK